MWRTRGSQRVHSQNTHSGAVTQEDSDKTVINPVVVAESISGATNP